MLIIVTNVRRKLYTSLRLLALLTVLVLVVAGFTDVITQVVENGEINHAPGQPIRVEQPLVEMPEVRSAHAPDVDAGTSAEELQPPEQEKDAGETTPPSSWLEKVKVKLQEYYRGGR